MPELERDALFAQHDRRALHPRAGFEAYQKIFCHDLLAGLLPPLRGRIYCTSRAKEMVEWPRYFAERTISHDQKMSAFGGKA
jgi:hypothetical protein